MAEEKFTRKLTTILAADVEGFTRLVRADEEATLKILDAYREIIDALIVRHGGRVFSTGGDSVLAEFASAVEAVRCAVSFQKAISNRNTALADEQKLMFRIGVNVGDVMVRNGDLLGDGVNVAARLEGLAEAGGVCISGSVFEQIKHKLSLDIEDMGKQEVKNIAEPISTYRLNISGNNDRLVTKGPTRFFRWWLRPARVGAGIALIALVGVSAWWRPWAPEMELASVERMALPLPDKPSLAVLPFTNMSNDPDQEFFVDGMTEDLITDLSKISGLFVIARNSTFVYKDTPVEIRTIAQTLGVRYVLEGSVRREGDQLRVNAQLIDATTGGHIWADRFDGKLTNIFAVQDEFVLKIVKALEIELSESEKKEIDRNQTVNIEAREAFQQGWNLFSKFNPRDNAKAESYLQKAIGLDPEYGRAYAALALVYYRGYRFSWEGPLQKSWERLRVLTDETLKKAKQFPTPLVHVVAALEHVNRGLADQARIEAARAIAMQPNDPEAHIAMALAMIISGQPGEGLNFVQAAMRLNPKHPSSYVFARGVGLFATGKLEQAAATFEEGVARDPEAVDLLPLLASVLAQLGRRQEARDTVLKWRPGLSQPEFQNIPNSYVLPIRWAIKYEGVRERLFDGLRVAVLPLDTTVSSLVGQLKAATQFDRSQFIRTLGWFGSAAAIAVPNLIEALGQEQQQLRAEAAITLGKIGPKARAAIPALAAISDDAFVAFHAQEALKAIRGI